MMTTETRFSGGRASASACHCLPHAPLIWPCQVCGLPRTYLYECSSGMARPMAPIGCARCADAIIRIDPGPRHRLAEVVL